MADKDNKIFDIAKPGSSRPETGSKPMVVGHKMMKDPTLTDKKDSEKLQENEESIAQTSKRILVPISQETTEKAILKTSEQISETGISTEIISDFNETDAKNMPDIKTDAKELEPHEQESDEQESGEQESGEQEPGEPEQASVQVNDKKVDDVKESNDVFSNEENLQKIIIEKTYNVGIEEATYYSVKTFIKTFLIVGLLVIIVLVILIDLEILNLRISLPFDVL